MAFTVTLVDAALLASLAVWLIVAHAQDAANRALAALLLLFAGSTLALGPLRAAPTPADAVLYSHVVVWYLLPTPFLLLLLVDRLFLSSPPPRWRRAALWGAGLATLALLVAMALEPGLFVGPPLPPVPPFSGWIAPGTTLTLVHAWALLLAEALAAVVAARVGLSPGRSPLQRRQAALVALAFVVLVVNSAGNQLWSAFLWSPEGGTGVELGLLWTLGALEAAAVLVALGPLLKRLEGLRRWLHLAVVVVAALDGAVDVTGRLASLLGAPLALREVTGRPIWQAAFAVMLCVAVLRYGLGGVARGPRLRVQAGAGFVLAAPFAAAGAATAIDAYGTSAGGLALAGFWLAAPVGLLYAAPLRTAPRALADRVLLDPRDPDVLRERARLYTDALRASARRGRRTDSRDPALRALRVELELDDHDHAILASLAEQALLDRYLVKREIGRGASGTALLATDAATGRSVVLKRFHARGFDKRAMAEVRALSTVRHPRVVPLLAVERVADEVVLVLAYAEGGSLQALLDREGRLPPERALRVVLDVLEGLEALHAAGITHGDVKPGNVLIGADGRALLADLGATQPIARREEDLTLTTAPVLGSYATVAPEVLRGARRSARSDLYSAGAILYRMLAGEDYVPLPGRDPVQVMDAILHEPPRLPHPLVPPRFEAVLRRALSKDPALRHEDAGRMREDLTTAGTPRGSAPLR